MPLIWLVALVAGGIAGIAGLLHLTGRSERARFADDESARRAWLREFPEAPPRRVTLCRDGHAALIATDRGPGIVWALGADSTARWLNGAVPRRTGDGLSVRLPDYTAPLIRLRLTGDEADLWRADMTERTAE